MLRLVSTAGLYSRPDSLYLWTNLMRGQGTTGMWCSAPGRWWTRGVRGRGRGCLPLQYRQKDSLVSGGPRSGTSIYSSFAIKGVDTKPCLSKLESIKEQSQILGGKSTALRSFNSVRYSEDVGGLLENLQEAVNNYTIFS